ncbi:hypothetical protein BH11PSE5_BH11PSE5_10700 [soil metagenome]
MKKLLAIAAASAAIALSAAPANAADVFTASFEAPALGNGGYAYQGTAPGPFGGSPTVPTNNFGIANVFFNGASGIQANNSAWHFASAPDGTQTAFIQSYNGTGGSISFDLSGLTAGKEYFITFAAAARPDNDGGNALTLTGPGGLSTAFSFTNTAWGYYQASFFATSGTNTLTLTGASASGDRATGIDAFTVAVPEPATWAMMLLGFGMMGYSLRRRKPVSSSALLAN